MRRTQRTWRSQREITTRKQQERWKRSEELLSHKTPRKEINKTRTSKGITRVGQGTEIYSDYLTTGSVNKWVESEQSP